MAQEDQEQPKLLNLRQKLAAIRSEIHNIEKRGKNTFHNYEYVTASDMAGSLGTALAKQNIISARRNLQITRTVSEKETIVEIQCEYGFLDGDSDEQIWQPAYGEGRDRGDKAAYKAFTGALKYFLVQAFLLATGDDPEADEEDQRDAKPNAPKTAANSKGKVKTKPDEGVELKGVELCRARAHHNVQNIIDAATGEQTLACVDCGAVPNIASEDGPPPSDGSSAREGNSQDSRIVSEKVANLRELVEGTKAPILLMMKQFAKGKRYELVDGELVTDITDKEYEKLIGVLENRKKLIEEGKQ